VRIDSASGQVLDLIGQPIPGEMIGGLKCARNSGLSAGSAAP
jgi:hypothetical protein